MHLINRNTFLMKKILFPLLAIVLLFSCSSDDDSNGSQNACDFDIPFMVEGNKWTMNATQFGFDAGQVENELIGCGNSGMEVLITTPNGNISNNWKQEDGYLWTDANDAADNDGYNRVYKINAELGDVFTYTKNDGTVSTTEVIEIDAVITVPAGTFVCDVYKKTSTSVINETLLMWNHEVGQIKTDSGFVIFELDSYDFN